MNDGPVEPEVLSAGRDRTRPPVPRSLLVAVLTLAGLVAAAIWLGPTVATWLRDTATVPRAGDIPVADGLAALRDAGLRAEVREQRFPCWPPGWVVDQEPTPGARVEPGTTVHLTVTDEASARSVCPGGVATQNDRVIVRRFIGFAEDPRPGHELRWADRVTVLTPQGRKVVPAEDVEDPEVWDSPDGPLLAGATTLGFNWVVQAAEERRCPGPPEFEDLRRLAVSDTDPTGAPDRRFDDCRPGSAFSLYVDTDYRIHGVQVVGPVTPVR